MTRRAVKTRLMASWPSVAVSVIALLGIVLGSVVWAISSPVGGSPDDDYHLGSIWCPVPVDESGCDYVESNGEIVDVMVPQTVAESPRCTAFKSDQDASCTDSLSDDRMVESNRFDAGNYPGGYYRFHNLLVGSDVDRSVLSMRIVNILLAYLLLGLVVILSPPELKLPVVVSAMTAWTPMGVYFIASNNPSSWTISGGLIYAAGLVAAMKATEWRQWALAALGAAGAVMAALSRADGAFYIFVISLAVWLLIPATRSRLIPLSVSVMASVAGLAVFFDSNQVSGLTADGGWPLSDMPLRSILVSNLLSLPENIGSLWGLTWGPGWFDVPLKGWSTLTMIFTAGGVVYAGARFLGVRKLLGGLVMAGALLGVPVVSMTLRHVQPVYYYQGRYTLPLLAVFFLVWLMGSDERQRPFCGRGQLVLLAAAAAVSNSLALHSLIVRYAVGTDAGVILRVGAPEWWPWDVSPTWMWILGSGLMLVGTVSALYGSRRETPRSRGNHAFIEAAGV